MGIDNPNQIDFLSIDKDCVRCSIVDSLDWTNTMEHLYKLQEKINKYLEFIESGQIYKDYLPARDKKIFKIHVFFEHQYPSEAKEFLSLVKEKLENVGYAEYLFEYEVISSDSLLN